MKLEIEITSDGSSTIFIPEWNERYHSKNGALQESLYIYIQNGLHFIPKNVIHILEIGFGTGLNVLLSHAYQKPETHIYYTTLEPFPLEKNIYEQLNFSNLKGLENSNDLLDRLHKLSNKETLIIHDFFSFTKHYQTIQEFDTNQKFDLVYWDAFGPRVQPEMWSLELCQKIYDLLSNGGMIVTYCSQGQFKRNLKQVGFEVEVLPGPPFKREMTRAIKK